jgi:plastocyanin
LVAVCALVVALTAACGSSEDEPAAPEQSATSSSTPPSSPSAEPSESSSSAPSESSAQGAEEVVITISDFAFEVPDSVPAGAEITIVNEDSAFHTVTADDGTFDVEAPGGESVTFTAPDEPGEYAFHCTPHPQMTATLVVG